MSSGSMRIMWDSHADLVHLRDMALQIWGQDAEAMMRDFQPTEAMLTKYEHLIVNCDKAIRGHRVLDMGCGHGLWSYMSMRHGASHVVGVEPRGMFVRGLNEFADKHQLPMQFCLGYDTDLARLLHEHDIDTVILSEMEALTDWDSMMRDVRRSSVKWVILQVTGMPDDWITFDREVHSGADKLVGYTLHYETHNSTMRSGINPFYKDRVDKDTGYQHTDSEGNFDPDTGRVFSHKRSSQYLRTVIDQAGFTVEIHKIQPKAIPDTYQWGMSHGLVQWYLLRNKG